MKTILDNIVSEVLNDDNKSPAVIAYEKRTNRKPSEFAVGDKCQVYSFGTWYAATVEKIGRTRITAKYTTGTGTTRVKSFRMNKIDVAR